MSEYPTRNELDGSRCAWRAESVYKVKKIYATK